MFCAGISRVIVRQVNSRDTCFLWSELMMRFIDRLNFYISRPKWLPEELYCFFFFFHLFIDSWVRCHACQNIWRIACRIISHWGIGGKQRIKRFVIVMFWARLNSVNIQYNYKSFFIVVSIGTRNRRKNRYSFQTKCYIDTHVDESRKCDVRRKRWKWSTKIYSIEIDHDFVFNKCLSR